MISLLKFNKEYYEPIIKGIKTQTIRKSNKRLRVDETVKAVFNGTDKDVKIRITNAGYKQFKYLDDEDAEREGFSSLKELKDTLMKIYPLLDPMTRIYYYRFEVI